MAHISLILVVCIFGLSVDLDRLVYVLQLNMLVFLSSRLTVMVVSDSSNGGLAAVSSPVVEDLLHVLEAFIDHDR